MISFKVSKGVAGVVVGGWLSWSPGGGLGGRRGWLSWSPGGGWGGRRGWLSSSLEVAFVVVGGGFRRPWGRGAGHPASHPPKSLQN